ncbi:hypothetical protein H8N03_11490 [Ramlibacter sp. USB13]|uniref:DUF2783 domain-containing protein n=1 Tax=Ramlibacter cellulosilyticus TaxID=2764187 RepID=A0A923MS31_9BURK|nr:hypothetical protein [Ramlibacter cellulosilyticus]MBC5783569.1 hypothetical protein [Ramlibacter cellulosilyticus]
MSDTELDRSYTALCRALGEVGPARSELLLAMVALGLMAKAPDAEEVLRLVARARERCLQDDAR